MPKKKKKSEDPRAWATRDELAVILGLSVQRIDQLRGELQGVGERQRGGRVRFFCRCG